MPLLKAVLLVLSVLSFSQICFGQDFSLSINAVYGTYHMKSMKSFQKDLYNDVASSLDVPFKVSDNFPGFIGYEFSAKLSRDKFFFGLQFASRSTGGRIGYADYSGSYTVDNVLINYEARGLVGTQIYKSRKVTVNLVGSIGIAITNHEFSSTVKFTSQEAQHELYKFTSNNFILSPGIESRYFFVNNIYLNMLIRYDYHFSGKLKFSENKNAYLRKVDGEEVKSDWSGIRGGLGIGIILNSK